MASPTVSFVIPCYKLAHLLPECIRSILSQSYKDFELLVMDDVSPDNTEDVANSFQDSRIRYIRNESNLGHLRNYNKGISLARGKYVWLISADDYLLKNYVLQRYVELLEQYSSVGFTFCPGVAVGADSGNEVSDWVSYGKAVHGRTDRIFNGNVFLKNLLKGNTIVAASGLVRRECYEKLGSFPLDMPWAGDWYLWCLFSLHYDVGYFSEPMVCYRAHELSMTNKLWMADTSACCEEDIAVPWAIKNTADQLGLRSVSESCLSAVAEIYTANLISKRYRMTRPSFTLEQFEESLRKNTVSVREGNWVRARVFAGIGNSHYWNGDLLLARRFYDSSIRLDPWLPKVRVKRWLVSLGRPGEFVWKRLRLSV